MRRGIVAVAVFFVCLAGFASSALASHFRYGHVSWQRPSATSKTVTFTITQVYRWSTEFNIQQDFQFGDGQGTTLNVTNVLKPPVGGMGGTIVEVNQAEDYFISKISVTHTYASAGTFDAGLSNCCRLRGLQNASEQSYLVRARVALGTATLGSAVSSVPPILKVPKATAGGFTYQLPFAQPGNENVTCSLATAADSGIPKLPGPFNGPQAGAYVDPYGTNGASSQWIGINAGCQLKWNPSSNNVAQGQYAVQVKLTNGSSSSVVDFIIDVQTGSNRAPTCTGLTGTRTLVAGQPFSASFVGSDPDSGSVLRVSHQGLPLGATLTPPSGTQGASPLNATFAWTPAMAQIGQVQAVTVTYTDSLGLQGNCGFSLSVITPDTDGDGVNDTSDNCPLTPNQTQEDFDGDKVGDACDPDIDDDGLPNTGDNCVRVPNTDQADLDQDGQGDLCDGDDDGDLVLDGDDNCAMVPNADQADLDQDGQGDACDTDDDNDGDLDSLDNCPVVPNSDQADLDGDGQGDACDSDVDGDGVSNTADNCLVTANADQTDTESDGIGDACDPDDDNDTIEDSNDNCVLAANTDQANLDGDSLGDVCDPDIDGDTVLNEEDNCPINANADQADLDGSGGGDVCDPDDDGDLVDDVADNCARIANSDQANLDGDALGDVCDDDMDGDNVLNTTDNCPRASNADQADLDHDGFGNLCDTDLDGDGVANESDNCEADANPQQADLDQDGAGDVCDPDADGDGHANESDNCPLASNANQANLDGDSLGDVCDPDVDGDSVANGADNCQTVPNADQADLDTDGQGDACDPDVDGDSVLNNTDNCPTTANANQADLDHDGQGDACDADVDGDGVVNTADQCPLVAAMKDADGNGCPDTAALLCGVVQQSGLAQGVTTSLCAKANNAATAPPATAANVLDAFIHEVNAQRGKKIAFSIADLLIAFATNAKAAL